MGRLFYVWLRAVIRFDLRGARRKPDVIIALWRAVPVTQPRNAIDSFSEFLVSGFVAEKSRGNHD